LGDVITGRDWRSAGLRRIAIPAIAGGGPALAM
jgi:hypothetical protein